MILPSRRARLWSMVSLSLAAVLVASYLWVPGGWPTTEESTPADHRRATDSDIAHGGSPMGLLYGTVGALLILQLLAFGIRKRDYRSTFGTLDGWLQAHIWLGLLCALAILLHTGFRFQDKVATISFLVLLAVVLSGLLGARLYATLPRRLSRIESHLSAEETSEQLAQIARSMARLASSGSPSLAGIYRRLIRQATPPPLAGWHLIFFGAGRPSDASRSANLESLMTLIDDSEREQLRKLLALWRQHRELHQQLRFQQRYRNLLDAWLYLHLPLSVVLVVLVAVHILAALYYRGLEVF